MFTKSTRSKAVEIWEKNSHKPLFERIEAVYLAGRADQREQDAKLALKLSHRDDDMEAIIARHIRAQGTKQDDSCKHRLSMLGYCCQDCGKPYESWKQSNQDSQCHPQPGKGDTYTTVDGKRWCSSCHAHQEGTNDAT